MRENGKEREEEEGEEEIRYLYLLILNAITLQISYTLHQSSIS